MSDHFPTHEPAHTLADSPRNAGAEDAINRLRSTKCVRPGAARDSLEGLLPRWFVEPETAAETAEVLKLCNAAGLRVVTKGGGTKMGWGNPPQSLDVILSTRKLDRIIEHAAGDLTATNCRWATLQRGAALQEKLSERGQWLALDPLWPERATVGGIIATNDSGALRATYGSLRDQLIGVTVVLADGTIARSGGKVVKNVAGYDLPKLFTGSLGTLGVITEATFRLYSFAARQPVGLICPEHRGSFGSADHSP